MGSVETWRAVLLEVVARVLSFLLVVQDDDVKDIGNAFLDNVASNVANASTLFRHVARAAIRNVDFIFV